MSGIELGKDVIMGPDGTLIDVPNENEDINSKKLRLDALSLVAHPGSTDPVERTAWQDLARQAEALGSTSVHETRENIK